MFNLLYKTRYGEEPTGKQAVFFACRPDDFDKCFDGIAKDIFASQDCAIYYIDSREAEEYAGYDDRQKEQYAEELSERLSGMRLFVIPVTARLLTCPSLALDLYDLMKEKKIRIPVLALMQDGIMSDPELAGLYALRFGDLQFLDKNTADGTMIPFAKKLGNYLSSVLIGDELAERVRAAFDAYIFLSYRKKDRAYAKELMRLIHKNKFCRDIAIWYDEFLTPGEGFNGAIEDEIAKSSLFALAVTPSLLEDGNYVMTKEYPLAREIGKTILPAQMVPTDRAELEKKYRGIPACTDANDGAELADALASALGNAVNLKNDKGPEHDFLIGLAYLAGIDVEADADRALGLITGAAEAGVIEAVRKLADMYRNGDGVGRDLSRAAAWQEKLAELCGQRYRESGRKDDRSRFADELMRSGDMRSDCGDLRKADKWYMQAAEIYEDIVGTTDDLHARWNLAAVYYGIGGIKENEWLREPGDESLEKAGEYYEMSLEISKKLADEINAPEVRRNVSVSYGGLSEFYVKNGKFDEAYRCGKESLDIAAALAKKTKTPGSLQDMYISCCRLGEICMRLDRSAEAREYYNEAVNTAELLAEKTEGASGKRELSAAYRGLGAASKEEGRLAEARGHFERALETAAAFAKEANTSDAREDLSDCCAALGEICKEEGRLTDALRYFGQFNEQAKAAVSADDAGDIGKPESERLSSRLAESYRLLGDTAFDEGLLGKAEKCYRQWLDIMFPCAYEREAVLISEYEMIQVAAFEKLGDTALGAGRLADALDLYRKAKNFSVSLFGEELGESGDIFERFGDTAYAEGMPSRAAEYYKRSLAVISAPEYTTYKTENEKETVRARILDKLGDICRAERRCDRSRKYYKDALEIRKKLTEQTEAAAAHRDYAMSYEKFVDTAVECGLLTGVLKHYNNILEIRLKLVEKTETSGPRIDLARSCDRLGDFYRSNGQPDRAREYYKKALAIREKVAKTSETAAARLDPAISYDKLGDTAREAGQTDEARAYYNKALGIRLALASETNLAAAARALALSYENLGDTEKKERRPDSARGYYDKAIGIMTALAEKTRSVGMRRGLALIYEKLGSADEDDFWYDEALDSYVNALGIRTELEKELDTAEARRELFPIYDRIGGIFEYQGPPENARGYFEESLKIKAKLAEESKTKEARLEFIRGCIKLGDLVFDEEKPDDARKYYEKAYDTASRLAPEERSADVLRELSRVYGCLSRTAGADGKYGEARGYLIKSHEIKAELADEAKTTEERSELADSYDVLGSIAMEENRFDDANAFYNKLYKLRTALEKETDTPKARRNVHLCLCDLGDTARRQKRFDEARDHFKRALDLAVALTKETKKPEARLDELFCIGSLGNIAKESGRRDEARDLFETALKMGRELEQTLDGEGRTEARRSILVSCDHLGKMEKEDGRTESARAYFEESYFCAVTVAEETKTDQSYNDLAFEHYNLGTLDYPKIDTDHILAAREIWESLAKAYPKNIEYASMRDACRQLLEQ